MARSFGKLFFGALALGASLFMAETAKADCAWLDAGNGSLDCELDVTGGCSAQCTPVTFTAQCGFDCEAQCDVTVDTTCTKTCQTTCVKECTPGSFDCSAYCETDCHGSCDTYCEAGPNHASCVTDCRSNCSTNCGAKCAYNPPTCDELCAQSCEGSCTSHVDASCQAGCQGDCSASLQGGCTAACSTPQGALFCNGYYVEAADVLSCFDQFSITASASCDATGCNLSASACSVSQIGGDAPLDLAAIGAMVVGAGVIVSRRRRAKK